MVVDRQFWRRVLPILWVGLLSWIAFFHRLGDIGLLDETEPLFVEAARQMWQTRDWITPYFNGTPRFDKPPLIYWLMSLSFQGFGISEWAARLPSALAGSAIVAMLFGILSSSRHQPRWLPYLGSAIGALNLEMVFFGRTGYSDMVLNACFTGSLLAFFRGYCQPETPQQQQIWYWLAFSLCGFGALTKGPIAMLLPGAIIAIFLGLTRNLGKVGRELPWKSGLLLMLGIALPWYVLVIQQHGSAFTEAFFGFHNVQRFTQVVNRHAGPWYYHFVVLGVGLLPWSIVLPEAISEAIKTSRSLPRSAHLGLLAVIWWGVVMGFFAIAATKYVTYSLPAVPASAILIALWWEQQASKSASKLGLNITIGASLITFGLLAIGSWYAPNWLNNDPAMPDLGRIIQATGLPTIGLMLWLAGLLLGLFYWRKSGFWRVQILTAAAFVLLFITPIFTVVDQARQAPLRAIARGIQQFEQPHETVAMGLRFFGKPSVVFYSGRSVALMNRSVQIPPYLAQLRRDRAGGRSAVRSVLLVTTADALDEAVIVVPAAQVLMRSGVYQLVRIPLE
jgi:4-amino-4-deoxy-L-arabinose transferase-like glycosyltransferase